MVSQWLCFSLYETHTHGGKLILLDIRHLEQVTRLFLLSNNSIY